MEALELGWGGEELKGGWIFGEGWEPEPPLSCFEQCLFLVVLLTVAIISAYCVSIGTATGFPKE